MSELEEKLNITLHGLYDFKDALVENKEANGAVAYNADYNEVIVKCDDEWYFIESSETNEHEKKLFEAIVEIAKSEGSAEQKASILGRMKIEHNTVEKDGEKTVNIINLITTIGKPTPKAPAASKEEYLENSNFGEF